MQDMEIFPLKFATLELQQQLEVRGRTFWSCRYKRFISYKVNGAEGLVSVRLENLHWIKIKPLWIVSNSSLGL